MKNTKNPTKKELEKLAEKVVAVETTKTRATKGVKRNTQNFAKQVAKESATPLRSKRAQAYITPSNFLNPLQALLVGDITKLDNERAYTNRLIKTTTTLASETKAQLQDILNIILQGMTNEITGQTSIDKIFIEKDVYDRLLFLLPTCLDPSINLKKISFKIVKEAIRSAYRVSMRRVVK